MKLEDLGFNDFFDKYRLEQNLSDCEIGRVIAEYRERYTVRTLNGESEAEITGNIRFTARNREDFPAVGDWVSLTAYDPDFAIINQIFPRFSVIKRSAVGQSGEIQVIAANIDYAFLVQAVGRDFNINRLERYLTICNSSGVRPVIILTKTDLTDDQRIKEILESVGERIKDVPVIPISNETRNGYDTLLRFIEKGRTYCMLGSSGAGKSTLINNISGKPVMKTAEISSHTNRGRHVTSHRELFILDTGGILIDNPGMREVGIADSTGGLEITFENIFRLSRRCRFRDCTHTDEPGCSVLEAVEKGEIDAASYENYLKMKKEKEYFESTIAERREKEKSFGKLLKNYKKDMKRNKL